MAACYDVKICAVAYCALIWLHLNVEWLNDRKCILIDYRVFRLAEENLVVPWISGNLRSD